MSASSARASRTPSQRKQAVAVRVADGSIRVDGVLDDGAWSQAVADHRLHPEGARRGRSAHRGHRGPRRLRRRALYIGARMHNRGRAADPGADGPAGRDRGAGRAPAGFARYLSRSPDGLRVRRDRHRRAHRPLPSPGRREPPSTRTSTRSGRRGPPSRTAAGPRSCGFRFRSFASTRRPSRSGG